MCLLQNLVATPPQIHTKQKMEPKQIWSVIFACLPLQFTRLFVVD